MIRVGKEDYLEKRFWGITKRNGSFTLQLIEVDKAREVNKGEATQPSTGQEINNCFQGRWKQCWKERSIYDR